MLPSPPPSATSMAKLRLNKILAQAGLTSRRGGDRLLVAGAGLYPVGRLDADVEGLLLLTNDGPLTHRLLHPRYEVPRLYEADVSGEVSQADLSRWRRGVELDDGPARPMAVELLHAERGRSRVALTF